MRQNATASIWSCSEWGLHSAACRQATGELLPRLSTITNWLPNWQFISVALSLESPPLAVSQHPALRSPDFPRAHGKLTPPNTRLSDLLTSFSISHITNKINAKNYGFSTCSSPKEFSIVFNEYWYSCNKKICLSYYKLGIA